MIPQLGGLVPKAQDTVISFRLNEGETITQFHMRALQIKSEIFLLKDEPRKIINIKIETSPTLHDYF